MHKFKKPMIALGTLIYPFYALPWIIKLMLQNDKLGYVLFSLAMAFFAYLMIPYDTMDLTRHYAVFHTYDGVTFSEFMNITFAKTTLKYYILHFYMGSINVLGLPQEFIPFSVIFFVYMLYFQMLRIILEHTVQKEIFGFAVLAVGIFVIINEVRFIDTASGLRNGFGFALFSYALILFYLKEKVLVPFILVLFSILIHVSILPLALLFLLSNILFMKNIFRGLFIVSLLLLVTGSVDVIFYKIISFLEPYLREYHLYSYSYMDRNGAWGPGFYDHQNMKTILFEKYIKPFPFYIIGAYLLMVKEYKYPKIENFLYLLFIFIALFSISRTMLDRYSYFFTLFALLVILLDFELKSLPLFKKSFVVLILVSMFLFTVANTVKNRDIFRKSWLQTLTIPAALLLSHHVTPNDYIKRKSL